MKIIATNRKARHDFHIEETYEAGIVLKGTEVKSLRRGNCSIKESFVTVQDDEIFLVNAHIAPYEEGNRYNVEPQRQRKLLMHKKEIARLQGRVREKGYTLVPLKIYFNEQGVAKVEVAVAKGLAKYDKRDKIKKREQERQIEKAIRSRR